MASPEDGGEVYFRAEEHATADDEQQTRQHGGGGYRGDSGVEMLRFAPQELGVFAAHVGAERVQGLGEWGSQLFSLLQRGDETAQGLAGVAFPQCGESVPPTGAEFHLAQRQLE